MVNVFVIEDHPVVVAGLDFLLSEPEERAKLVGSARSVGEALQKIPLLEVHVVLLDLFLREEPPLANLQLLRESWPDLPVVVYSAEDSNWWKRRMFEEGANAYLNKWIDNETLILTILKVADGSVVCVSEMREMGNSGPDCDASLTLTLEELTVGKEISNGVPITEIAKKLDRSPSAIEKILRSIRLKIGTQTNGDIARILISRKLLLFAW